MALQWGLSWQQARARGWGLSNQRASYSVTCVTHPTGWTPGPTQWVRGDAPDHFFVPLSGQRLGLEAWPPPVDGGTAGDTIRLFTRGAQSDPQPPSIWAPCGADPRLVSEGLFWAAVSLASGSSKVIPAERHELHGGQLLHRASWAQGRANVRHPSPIWPPSPSPAPDPVGSCQALLPFCREVRGQRG